VDFPVEANPISTMFSRVSGIEFSITRFRVGGKKREKFAEFST
jgi:hypothetical protein